MILKWTRRIEHGDQSPLQNEHHTNTLYRKVLHGCNDCKSLEFCGTVVMFSFGQFSAIVCDGMFLPGSVTDSTAPIPSPDASVCRQKESDGKTRCRAQIFTHSCNFFMLTTV